MGKSERRNKKRKGVRNFFIVTTLILLAGIIYGVVQYNSGLAMANEGLVKEDEKLFD